MSKFKEKEVGISQKILSVVGYARVSTEEQAKGQSTNSQIHYLEEWAKQKGWNYTKSYIDNGFSGGNENRPGLQEMLKGAEEHKFDGILISHTDRLSRNATFAYDFFEQLIKLDMGVGSLSLSNYGIIKSLDDPMLNIMIRMSTAFDEYFRKLTIFKTKAGMKALSDQGRHMGRPPTFFKINKKSGKLVVEEQELLNNFRELMNNIPIPKKRPYGYYTKLSRQLGMPYKRLWFAIQDKEKYKDIK